MVTISYKAAGRAVLLLMALLVGQVSAENFQAIRVRYPEVFQKVRVICCTTPIICSDVFDKTVTLGYFTNETEIYVDSLTTGYDTSYYCSTYLDDFLVDTAVKTYLGRGLPPGGNITGGNWTGSLQPNIWAENVTNGTLSMERLNMTAINMTIDARQSNVSLNLTLTGACVNGSGQGSIVCQGIGNSATGDRSISFGKDTAMDEPDTFGVGWGTDLFRIRNASSDVRPSVEVVTYNEIVNQNASVGIGYDGLYALKTDHFAHAINYHAMLSGNSAGDFSDGTHGVTICDGTKDGGSGIVVSGQNMETYIGSYLNQGLLSLSYDGDNNPIYQVALNDVNNAAAVEVMNFPDMTWADMGFAGHAGKFIKYDIDYNLITSAELGTSDYAGLFMDANGNNVILANGTHSAVFNGPVNIPSFAGGGNQFVCVDNDGNLYANPTGCT
jgi:hypothetical protein